MKNFLCFLFYKLKDSKDKIKKIWFACWNKRCKIPKSWKCNINKKSAQNRLIAVLDTNVLLSNNKSIQKLIEKEEVFSHLIFVIPWVVIQELDQCKGKDNTTNINIKAQTSIKLLHKVLKLGLNESVDKKFIFENNLEVRWINIY